jgi:uroporphyrin-III C-methyltransferase
LLDEVDPQAELHDVGRRAGVKRLDQSELNALLVRLAGSHEIVVRLKGGDPFVFGRGGEEAIALSQAGVPFEVVPGVTAGGAVPAYAGIPLTHRGVASSVTFLTGHQVSSPARAGAEGFVPLGEEGTLVIFMGLLRVEAIARGLVERGLAPDTPAALIESGTYRSQRTVTGVLSNLAERVSRKQISGPALIVVGRVVTLRDRIRWFPEADGDPGQGTGPRQESPGARDLPRGQGAAKPKCR